MTNLDSILESRDITLPTKVRPVKAMVFPVVTYGLDYKESCVCLLVTQSCLPLCDPMDCSTSGKVPVHHQIPEPAQTHVHRVGDTIQPSHPLSSPSPPTFKLSQHQSVF